MDVLAYPLTFTSNGRASLVEQNSEQHFAQQISQFVHTRIGELGLSPDYGIEDPVFNDIDTTSLLAGINVFHPKIEIDEIEKSYEDNGILSIEIKFKPSFTGTTSRGTVLPLSEQVIFGA